MARTIFEEFDQFADAINGVAGRFVPTGRAETDWWVQVVPIGSLAIQQVQIGSASLFAGDGRDRAITLGVPVTSPQRIRIDGDELGPQSFIAVREGQPFTFAARQSTLWAGVTIPIEGPLAEEIVELLCPPNSARALSGTHNLAPAAHLAQLRSIITRVGAIEETSALSGTASRTLEEQIILLASRMLQTGMTFKSGALGRPRYNRNLVIARVLDLLQARQREPLFLRDICEAARVGERTLRTIFHEYFGVSPMRLIRLRRLHEIHRALLRADARQERLGSILKQFGVLDPTIFARNYKILYGQLPSQTLRRTVPSSAAESLTVSWLRYAARKFEDPGSWR